jgi:hypothetical protein
MIGCVNVDPNTVNDAAPTATLGGIYNYQGGGSAPSGLYRYVQIKDLAVADGDVLCPDDATGYAATKDRSADLVSTVVLGVAVGTVTADYYAYILIYGRHANVLTDGSVAAGEALYAHGSTDGAASTRGETVASTSFADALETDDSDNRIAAMVHCM